MRILFISSIIPYPPHIGVSQRTYNVLKRVAAVHDVVFIGFEKNEDDHRNVVHIRDLCSEVHVYRLPDDWSRLSFLRGVFTNLLSPLPYTAQKYYQHSVAQLVKNMIETKRIDVLHVDMADLARYGDVSNLVPKVLTHHNLNSLLWKSQAVAEQSIVKKYYMLHQAFKFARFEKKHVPRYDINVTVSPLEKESLQEITEPNRVKLIPNGVDIDYFKPTEPDLEEDGHVIFAGPLRYYPNAVAIKWWCEFIVPALHAKGLGDTQLTVLGGAHKASKSVSKYLSDPARYNLILPGFVDDVRPYVSRASAYVVPLQSGGGTRLKILNALAMGKAVVSTSVGCEGLLVRNGKNIVIADKPQDFVEALSWLFVDKDLRITLGREGREVVERHYAWDIICSDIFSVYQDLHNRANRN